jgi:3'-5' exoribonuclease
MKKNFVREINEMAKENQPVRIESLFVIGEKKVLPTKTGKPYVHLLLQDRTGSIKAKIWDNADIDFDSVPTEGVVYITGQVESFNNTAQIVIEKIELVDINEVNPSDFVPASKENPEKLLKELKECLKPAFSGPYKTLLERFFRDKELVEFFKKAPGAVKVHHAYIGGLLEHTLNVVRLCSILCDLYPFLDKPLLLTGALIHDIGKIREYRYDWKLDLTDEGKLIGHTVLGVQILNELIRSIPSFPSETATLLRHMILSHHGEIETGAVRLPMTREALALHMADNLDAKMASVNQIYEETGAQERWTEYQKLYARQFFIPVPGQTHEKEEDTKMELPTRGQKSIQELFERIIVELNDKSEGD